MVSAEEIENALRNLFIADGKFQLVEIGATPSALRIPGINWAVMAGVFDVAGKMVNQSFEIVGELIVKNIASESQRRKAMHPFVIYVIQKTMFNNLGLDMDLIKPVRWADITTVDDFKNGLLRFEIKLRCKSNVVQLPSQEVEALLLAIDASFTLQPDNKPVMAGSVSFEESP